MHQSESPEFRTHFCIQHHCASYVGKGTISSFNQSSMFNQSCACIYCNLATLLFHGFCTVVTSFGLSTAIIVILRSRHCTSYFCRSDQWLNIVSNPGDHLNAGFDSVLWVYCRQLYIIQIVILRSLNELEIPCFPLNQL